MHRKAVYSIAALVVAAGVGVGVISAGADTSPSNPGPPVSPQEKLDQVVRETMSQFDGDTVKIAGPSEDDVYFATRSDFAAMVRASNAKALGVEYDQGDAMVSVVDESGNKVGYFAAGAGFIPQDIADAPGFDLCQVVDSTVKTAYPDGAWSEQKSC